MRSPILAIVLSIALASSSLAQPCVPSWSPEFSIGPLGYVESLVEFDEDGAGPQPPVLIAGGRFSSISNGAVAHNIARYDGTSWSQLGPGLGSAQVGILDLATFDEDGDGPNPPRLFIAGDFTIRLCQ